MNNSIKAILYTIFNFIAPILLILALPVILPFVGVVYCIGGIVDFYITKKEELDGIRRK